MRLFNLAPDPMAFGIGLRAAGKTFANGVKYSLGSSWYDVGTADIANTYTGSLKSVTICASPCLCEVVCCLLQFLTILEVPCVV